MKTRDKIFFWLGIFLGSVALYGYILSDWEAFKKQVTDLKSEFRKNPPVQQFKRKDGSFKFLGWHGEKDPEGKRVYPPPHPGGRRTNKIDEEMFTVMQDQKLKPEEAWQELIHRYPETLIKPETGEPYPKDIIISLKQEFKERMRNRKRKR